MIEGIELKQYLHELKKHTAYDFSDYSDNSIHRRILKILKDYDISMEQLIERTKSDSAFVEKVVEEITVNTTELFRDTHIWSAFYEKIYPSIKSKKFINIWHAGCSSGMEVYSNLILLNELGLLDKARVYATDINTRMVTMSKNGQYNYRFNYRYLDDFNSTLAKKPINGISKIDFSKYFDIDEDKDTMTVKAFLRKVPQFIKHDLVQEEVPFFNKFDIVFCRNVLIYFNSKLQSKIFKLFYEQMYPGSFLLLGNHEVLSGFYKTKFIKNGPVFVKNTAFHFKY
ncbi:CheR family methyltransferase [Carboxylicivirga sp. N1Y90]|uniref:CheR family methyltransferase n=1 Tax=Carboxylicivirga fragile TaxID=3417571 RepID=UPI003D32D342